MGWIEEQRKKIHDALGKPGPSGPAAGNPGARNGANGARKDGSPAGGPPAPARSPVVPPRRQWLIFILLLLANYWFVKMLFGNADAPITIPYTEFRQEVASGNVEAIYSKGESIEGRFAEPVTWPRPTAAGAPSEGGTAGTGPAADRSVPAPSSASGNSSAPASVPAASSAPATSSSTATPAPAAHVDRPPSRQAAAASGELGQPRTSRTFETTLPVFVGQGFEQFLIDHKVEISAVPIQQGSSWGLLLFGFGPAILIIAFYVWMFRRAQAGMGGMGGMMGIGKSKARRYDQTADTRVTFDDVAGIDEAENELIEIVDFLKDPAKYTRLGGTAPKGVLLVGAPGTGKTLLAKAVAGEAGVPFFSMSASEFVEMIVGVGAARVRDLFKQARENAPAIIFVDELDAIGRARGQLALGGGSSEQEQTLNQLLTEMDGFSSREGIIVLAATNQPDVLDKALLRPGRFDRRVVVNLPDRSGREAILKVHTRNVPFAKDVELSELASTTPGFSGADLKNLVNEAALTAARREQDDVRLKDFMDALEKIILGPERPLLLDADDRMRIAYHESGHAILGLVMPGADPVNRVSIVPRGRALGVTYQRPDADRYNYPEAYLRARIVGMLGGRAAEELVYGTRTTGAENDIEQATQLARNMVTRWGMSEKLGLVQLAPRDGSYLGNTSAAFGRDRPFSEETARIIDDEVHGIIDASYEQAMALLRKHRRSLEALVEALLKRETLEEREILEVTGLPSAPALETKPLAKWSAEVGSPG